MPYAIRLPDGTLVQNIPDDLAPEEAKRRIIAAGLVSQPAPPETTFLGQTKEAFKGLIPGAVGLVESAAIGASALLPEEQERAAREAIARVAGAAKAPFAPAPGYEESIIRKGGEAVGSTIPFLLAGPLGLAGRAAAVGLGVGAGAGEARTRAEAEGATEEQRGTATALGTIPGALEIFAPFRILSRIPEGEALTAVAKVKRVLQAAGEEAAQEAASGLAQNMIARGVYKPDQALIEGLGEQAAYGGATGAIVQGLMDLALGRRARGAGAGAAAAPAEGQPGELPVDRLRREQAQEIATRAEAKREPINRAQTVIDETLAQPITEAYPRLTQEIETLKQQPESKERNAAIRELEAERARRQREDTERARAGKKVAEGFLTAEEAAAQGVTPREEFDPTEARREEIARLRAQREGMLVKGKPPAPKTPARRRFDELDARLVEIGGGRWTPTMEPPAATEPTTPTVEEPTVRGPAPLPDVLDSATIRTIGFTRGRIHDALVGKSITDPEIRTILEDAKERTTSSKTAAKIDTFVARLPEPITPTVETASVEPTTPYGSTEFPAAEAPTAETAAPAPPEATPEQRADLAEQVERISGQMTEEEYAAYVKEHVDETGERIRSGAEHISAVQEILRRYGVETPELAPTPTAEAAPAPAPEVPTTPTAEAAPAPITETPSAPSLSTEPERIGAGVPVAGGPAAVSPAEGVGAAEPVRVVPPVEDVGRPVAGEGEQPAAVTPPTALATRQRRPPEPIEAEPERPGALVGERTEATAGDAIGRTLGERKTIGLRAQATDSLAGVEAEFGYLYGNSIRDNSGNMNPVVLLSQALDAPRFAQEMLRVGTIVVDPSGLSRITELDYNGQKISFEGVLRDIAAEAKRRGRTPKEFVKEIGEVLAGRREYELMKDNDARKVKLEFYLTPEEAEAANEKFSNDAFIKNVSDKMDAIRFAGLDFLVATGRITKDKAKEWKEATAYIPFKRIEELDKFYVSQGQGGVSTNFKLAAFKQMKEFKGSSERQTENPIENFVGLMEWMTREGMKAEAVGRALRDLELVGAAKYLPRGRDQMPQSQKGAVVSSWQKGQQKFYYVPDPANLAAFAGAKSMEIGRIMRAAQSFSQVLRVGVTITPAFALKQIADDITRAYVHSGVKNPMALIPRILSNMPRNWWNEIKGTRSAGVAKLAQHGVVPAYDTVQGGNVRNIFEETGISKRSTGRAILRILEAGAKASDVSVRQAIYDQTMKETGDVALAESRAREIINFSRRGASTTADFFIRTIPFFNAYARSMDKLILAAGGGKTVGVATGYARNLFFKRMGILTAMGLSYALLMSDDEEYQNLSDHVRDRNWVLPYGKELGYTPVIPLPPELSFFFKAIPERVVQYYKLQGTPEERDALRVARELMLSGVDIFWAPNLTPQLVKPFFENLVNYSFFLGRPLESQSQLRLDASRRFGTGTSEAVKAAAEALAQRGIELSPIKIENAIRGVFGMSAGLALSVADVMVNPTRTDRPLHQHLAAQLTGASAFMKDPVGTRFLDDMYDFEDKVAQAYNTYNRLVQTDPQKADAYLLQNYGRYSVYEATKAVMESIRDLNKEAQIVDRAKDIPPDERRQIMNTLRAQQNELAQISYALRRQAQINQAEIDLR